jgi:hypothetical protein
LKISSVLTRFQLVYTICPADNATAGSLGRRRTGQLRFGFVAVSAGHIVYTGCPITHAMGFIVKNPSKRSVSLKKRLGGKKCETECQKTSF